MRDTTRSFTLGVEEEYQIVDAETYALRPRAARILEAARRKVGSEVQPELVESQIEIGTPVCETLADVRAELVRLRAAVSTAAEAGGSRIAAMGTHPFTHWIGQTITAGERYERLEEDFQQLAREQLICGCHVHVSIPDRELRIQVLDRVRVWLPVLLALSANSPFSDGVDSGYASWRAEVFGRFPTTGIPRRLGSVAEYDAVVAALRDVGLVEDGSFLYWDVRPSTRFVTLEFRVADVCQRVDEAVLYAALCRALVRTAVRDVEAVPVRDVRPEVMRAARWQASRYGLDGDLVDLAGDTPARRPARDVVDSLVAHVRDDLVEHGEWDEVHELLSRLLADGTGASRQRAALRERASLAGVVAAVTEETVRGVAGGRVA